MLDLISFPDHARLWIYGSDQKIADPLIPKLFNQIHSFSKNWVSHNSGLRSSGGILHNYFAILIVDEDWNKPGGCSIDSSVHFIQSLEKEYQLQFFNRDIFHYLNQDNVVTIHKDSLAEAYSTGSIHDESLFFDPLVNTKSAFQKEWVKPLHASWQKRFL